MSYNEKPRMMVLKGLIQIIISYILYRYGDMYGYQIKKNVEKFYNKKIPQGMIYVTLRRMRKNNILDVYEKDGKQYYRLTDAGLQFFRNHIEVLRKADKAISEILTYMDSEVNKTNSFSPSSQSV
ncbi:MULTISPECIES: PadR family transcriptional regulator [Acidianus]|uniref:PadR family transcriptional regulator n=1 Tax=Candidatus Acidianus copahuensis TaxID=1160895 RepID=A0A031LQH9_9CREN|nr:MULTISPECIES: PadR family transcriptional regulator [Acidianus]EZQ07005.1 PadR family transcriptional regulator [Candidatus Acidianus copahuensis]NON61163.1 PadR family transcriptional regulator [Acidianus sp. RZ1]